jgi:hypothetical protein
MQTPCRSCNHRKLHCHNGCEEYKQFRIKLDAANDVRKKSVKEIEQVITSVRRCQHR